MGHLDHECHQASDSRRIGPAAEADDKSLRAALPQVVEEPQRHRPCELFFLEVWAGFPSRRLRLCHFRFELWPDEGAGNFQWIWPAKFRLETRQSGGTHAGCRDIDNRTSDVPRRERQSRPHGQQRTARGDQGTAIVDEPARLVAQQVGVDIADVERPRALDHEPLADVDFAEGEVARTWIEDDVDSLRRHASAGSARHPGVLADLEADLHATAIEYQVADRILLAAKVDRVADLLGPGLEPARLVVQTVAAEEPLGNEARDPPIDRQAGTVEQGITMQERQAQAHDHAPRGRKDCFERFPDYRLESRPVEGILAAVAGDAHFRQAKDRGSLSPSSTDRRQDVLLIARPIQGSLIQHGCRNSDTCHGSNPRALRMRLVFRSCSPSSRPTGYR